MLSWMIDEFIHWPKLYLLLSSTCDETLSSWMIIIWMKNHLVSDSNCKSIIPPKKSQGMTNNGGVTLSVGDNTPRFPVSIEQNILNW
jgi:hypothetical protein